MTEEERKKTVSFKDGTVLKKGDSYSDEEWGDILLKKEMEIRDIAEKTLDKSEWFRYNSTCEWEI